LSRRSQSAPSFFALHQPPPLTPTEVGSSADANYASEAGAVTIDGFGMEGGGAHSLLDYADFATLTPRAYLLARLLMDVGHEPGTR